MVSRTRFQQPERGGESDFWEGEIKAVPAGGCYIFDFIYELCMAVEHSCHTKCRKIDVFQLLNGWRQNSGTLANEIVDRGNSRHQLFWSVRGSGSARLFLRA